MLMLRMDYMDPIIWIIIKIAVNYRQSRGKRVNKIMTSIIYLNEMKF